jgi:hypothetical protein
MQLPIITPAARLGVSLAHASEKTKKTITPINNFFVFTKYHLNKTGRLMHRPEGFAKSKLNVKKPSGRFA